MSDVMYDENDDVCECNFVLHKLQYLIIIEWLCVVICVALQMLFTRKRQFIYSVL
jgi:hypothetical protein